MSLLEASFAVLCALTAVAVGLGFVAQNQSKVAKKRATKDQGVHFLFRKTDLEHASPNAQTLFAAQGSSTDWDRLRAGLRMRFPNLPDQNRLDGTQSQTFRAASPDDHAVIQIRKEDDMVRLTIEDSAKPCLTKTHSIRSMEAELGALRSVTVGAPYPIWMEDRDGNIGWRNKAYEDLMAETSAENTDEIPLFDMRTHALTTGTTDRLSVRNHQAKTLHWFNVTATEASGSTVYHAVNINAVIEAEAAQRNFVQTLVKTFAQLSIGLAIFDRSGQLALFNPAIVDLTDLPAEFLSARPDLLSFFDRLRDNRVMPEPKDYRTWRQDILDVIAAATNGCYQETWSLDTGHTYRVIGRPHPDGAVAFLIEDITAEVAMTRNFRAELELVQSLMDTFEDALAVFSSSGVLTFCNAAYGQLWKIDPESTLIDVTIVDSIKVWQSQCRPDPAWGDMRDFVMKLGERAPWDARVVHLSYGPYIAQVSPITSRATLIRFTETISERAASNAV